MKISVSFVRVLLTLTFLVALGLPGAGQQPPRIDFDKGPDASLILSEALDRSGAELNSVEENADPTSVRKFRVSRLRSEGNVVTVVPSTKFWPPPDNPTQPCIDTPPGQDDSGGTIRNRCQDHSSQPAGADSKSSSQFPDRPSPASILGPFATLVKDSQDYQKGLRVKQQLDGACGVGVRAIPPADCTALGQRWVNIQSVRADLATRGTHMDSYDNNLEVNVPRLNSWLDRIQKRRDAIENLRGKFNAGCNPCRTDQECAACNRWANAANTCVSAHNASSARRREEFDKWNAAYNCLKPQGDDFRNAVTNWVNQIRAWIEDARRVLQDDFDCVLGKPNLNNNNGTWALHCPYTCKSFAGKCGIARAFDHEPTVGEIDAACPDFANRPPVDCPAPFP